MPKADAKNRFVISLRDNLLQILYCRLTHLRISWSVTDEEAVVLCNNAQKYNVPIIL